MTVLVHTAAEAMPTAGLGLWLDAGQGVDAGGDGSVWSWRDRSINGLQVTQTDSAKRPRLVAAALNGKPVVRFDGLDDNLVGRADGRLLFGTDAATIYVVQRQDPTHAANTTFTWLAPDYRNWVNTHLAYGNSLIFDFGNAGAGGRIQSARPFAWSDAYHVVELYRSGQVGWIWADGMELARGQFAGVLNNALTGDVVVGGLGGAALQGEIAELIVYTRALSDDERTQVRGYLGAKYGLVVMPNQPPVVAIRSPTAQMQVRMGVDVNLVVEASDPDGAVASVRFFGGRAGGSLVQLGETNAPPYQWVWRPGGEGNWSVQARAIDNRGATGVSAVVTFKVLPPNRAPLVAWVSPADGAAYRPGEAITLEAVASDPDGQVVKVTFVDGANVIKELTANPYCWQWASAPGGLHQLKVRAEDNEGGTGESSVIELGVYSVEAGETLPVAGLRLWLEAGQGVEASPDGSVSAWQDRSVYGHRVAQADSAKRPRLIQAALNGRPAISFDGLNDTLGSQVEGRRLFGTNAGTIYVVQRQAGRHLGNTTFTWLAPNYDNMVNLHLPYQGKLIFDFGYWAARVFCSAPVWWPDAYHVVEAHRNGQVAWIWAQGEELVRGQVTSRLYTERVGELLLGGDGREPSYQLQGEIAEIMVYNRALSEDERAAARMYLGDRYSLPVRPNQPPMVTVTSPLDSAVYQAGDVVPLTAEAEDPEGKLAKVQFFDGTNVVAEVRSAPWSFNWTGATLGEHILKARAIDDMGHTGDSALVKVTVAPKEAVPIAGLVLWLDAGQGVDAGVDGLVQAWHDRSANGLQAAQADPSERPRLIQAALNGKPVIRFDGVNDALRGQTDGRKLFEKDAATIYVVQRQAGTHPANTTFTWLAPNYANWVNLHLAFSGSLMFDFGDASEGGRIAGAGPPWWPEAYHLVEACRSGQVGWIWAGGEELVRGQFRSTLETGLMGDLVVGGLTGAMLQGDIAEIMVYNRGLSEAERTAVRTYLTLKYALWKPICDPPVAALIWPLSGAVFRLGGDIHLEAVASDPADQVARVQFYAGPAGGTLEVIGELTAPPWTLLWRPSAAAEYVVKVVAINTCGARGESAPIQLKVKPPNLPPVVQLVSPPAESAFRVGEVILLEAQASDPDGVVAKVALYDGTNLIAQLTQPPYRCAWSGASVGLCQLKAVAVDSEAAQGESPVVETPVYAAGEIPVAGLRLWLDASQGVEAGTGSLVTSWRERGAYGHTVAQPDIAKRPLLAPAALNGKPVLRFDGVDDSLRGTAFGSTLFKSNAVSILIVQCQAANHPENATLAWNPDDFANQVSLRLAFDGRLLFDYGDPTAGARVSATQPVGWGDNYHLVEAYRDAASRAAIRVDGLELAKRSLAGRLQLDVAGSLAVGGDDYTFLGGEVAEIIVYNRTLTPVEQRLVQLYLVAKYGLAAVSYPSVLEQPRRLPDGRFGLTLAGKPGAEHVVEVSADLLSWVTLTNVAGLAPGVEVVDPDAANHGQRFYRSVMP